jgi:WD repeat-containing protein 26
MPKVSVDFAGPSYFGGKNDQLVLCAGKAGDIHIWDQESGSLLHHFRAQELGSDLTCIAWNHAAEDPFMFATGSHDGAIRIWSKPPEEPVDNELDGGGIIGMVPRTASPSAMDDEWRDIVRTESPVDSSDDASFDSDQTESAGNGNGNGNDGAGSSTAPPTLSLRDRVVAFAAASIKKDGDPPPESQ